MDWKIELVAVPVSDVDRAKTFYSEQVGFVADHDYTVSDEVRFVQLTPPGSACSIAIGKGMADAAPGSLRGMQMVVSDVGQAGRNWSAVAWQPARCRSSRGAGSCSSRTRTATSGHCRRSCRADDQARAFSSIVSSVARPVSLRTTITTTPTASQTRPPILAWVSAL